MISYMESHKIMCHFLYYWSAFGPADRLYDISSASGNNSFQFGFEFCSDCLQICRLVTIWIQL